MGIVFWANHKVKPLRAIEPTASRINDIRKRVICDILNHTGHPISNKPAGDNKVKPGIDHFQLFFVLYFKAPGQCDPLILFERIEQLKTTTGHFIFHLTPAALNDSGANEYAAGLEHPMDIVQ